MKQISITILIVSVYLFVGCAAKLHKVDCSKHVPERRIQVENVRIYEIPNCKMVSSQCGMFGDGKLERFDKWFSSLPKTMFPKDFLWYDNERKGYVWYYMYSEGMNVPDDFNIVDFSGGLYAVTTDVDGKDNKDAINAIKNFIEEKGCFEEDTSRVYLGNIPTPLSAKKAMGYNQMDYYIPIKIK